MAAVETPVWHKLILCFAFVDQGFADDLKLKKYGSVVGFVCLWHFKKLFEYKSGGCLELCDIRHNIV